MPTIRYPRGLKPIAKHFAAPIAKLARNTVSKVTGEAPEEQWNPDVKPLGAGSWGVVWPLADERFILKLTADPTEGPVVQTILKHPHLHNNMGIIHYFALKQVPPKALAEAGLDVYRKKTQAIYVIVAERLQHSSAVPFGGGVHSDVNRFAKRLGDLKLAAGALVHELSLKKPRPYKIDDLHAAWITALHRLNEGPIEDFVHTFFDFTRNEKASPDVGPATGGILADIHFNNVGKRVVDWSDCGIELSPSNYWVISDPGHSSLADKPEVELLENPKCQGDLFHATTFASLEAIAEHGLQPRQGAGLFQHGGYAEHSQGKVFLARGRSAALEWFSKVEDIADHHYGDDDEPDAKVPVLLRITKPKGATLHVDEVGSRDVPCSFYLDKSIPPHLLEFFDAGSKDWVGVDEWMSADPYLGLKSVEHYNEDGDVVGEKEDWTSRGFYTVSAYENGGFKPDRDDADAWDEDI